MDQPLASRPCVPCTGQTPPLSREEITALLRELPGWELRADGAALTLKRSFKNFKQSLEFVNKVADIAEAEKHHPDISFGWGYAELALQTHSIGGLHRNDFIVAAKINRIAL